MPATCPQCGSEISADGGAPMCPRCLLGLGLADTDDDGGSGSRADSGASPAPSAILTLPVGAVPDPRATLTPGAPRGSSGTESLLRGRLRTGCWIILLGLLAFIVRDVLSPDGELVDVADWVDRFAARVSLVLFYGAAILLLRSDYRLTVKQLRALEASILWAVALWFATDRVYWTQRSIAERNVTDVTFFVAFSFLTYFAFISAYGLFAPNTWRRTLYMTGPIALMPVAVLGYIAYSDATAVAFMREAGITGIQVSSLVMMLGIGVMIAVWGAHRIHTLRLEVREAKRLGQYRLVERIGQGGMGEVWKAQHRLLARPAAVKLVKPGVVATDPAVAHDFMRSFAREAQITANLRSTHTVELYDFGLTSEGVFYYVMELLGGRDLESLVRDFGPLDAGRAAYILEQACDSLAEAHDQGLVHRDVKPANIQVCRLGRRYDFVKVLDFGLAKVLAAGAGGVTRAGTSRLQLIGTPSYIAPETASGGDVDARADIYSLGCVGYWLLTGRLVFEGSSPAEIVQKHLVEAPVEPRHRVECAVPATLEAIVMRCLDKNREARPQSADELAAALHATGLSDGWSQQQARVWWRQRGL